MTQRIIVFDTETYPFYKTGKATKCIVPRLVCLSWADGTNLQLLERERAVPLFRQWLEQGDITFVGLNLAFDLLVMARALEEEYPEQFESTLWPLLYNCSKWDISTESKLFDISCGGMFLRGRYNLAALVKRWLGEEMGGKKKEGLGPDVFRMRYNELDGEHTDNYPEAAYAYALNDADVTYRVFAKLQTIQNPNRSGTPIRSQYAFDFQLMSAWGLRVDGQWVRAIKTHYTKEMLHYEALLSQPSVPMEEDVQAVIQDGKKKSKVIQAVILAAWLDIGEAPTLTPTGKIKTDAKVMKYLESKGVQEPIFQQYSRFNRSQKFLSTYVEPLIDAEDGPICPRYSELMDTGRSSSGGPNVQNFPSRINKQDKALLAEWNEDTADPDAPEEEPIDRLLAGFVTGPDLRGAIIPREGCVFVAADYTAAEMAGLAQTCQNIFGYAGTLAKAINAKLDLHLYVAAKLLGCSYKEVEERYNAKEPKAVEMRQISKIANFGFAGGASAKTFIDYAAGYDVKITLKVAEAAKAAWLDAWTEMPLYFRYIKQSQSARGSFHIEQHGPNRMTSGWRLRVTGLYTQAANTGFQGIVADGAIYALHLIVKACYTEKDSVLYGSRPLLFIHDEIIIESPEDKAEECATELSRLMVLGLKKFLPDMDVIAEPTIMKDRWSK